jgi:hypothetical protein
LISESLQSEVDLGQESSSGDLISQAEDRDLDQISKSGKFKWLNPNLPCPGCIPAKIIAGRRKLIRILSSLLFMGTLVGPAFADPISFTVTPSTLNAGPGQTVIFVGQITNTSGNSLNASDLFFNFSNYDFSSIADVTQLLGDPDFALPNNTFSPVTDLFSVTLDSAALPGIFTVDVSLEDVFNDLSATETVDIVNASAVTPEPSTLLLCSSGTLITLLAAYVSRSRMHLACCVGRGEES